jgi:hypothetical protein
MTAVSVNISAQDYSNLDKIQLNTKTNCAENETLVLECCNYILASPVNELDKDKNRLAALQFIMRWMEATPEYSFMLDESMAKVSSADPALLGVFLSCMSKYAVENKTDDPGDVKYNSFLTFIKYCEDPASKVKLNKDLKELIDAKNTNSLKDYLKIPSKGVLTLMDQ